MKKEATEQSIGEMQKSVYMKNEKTMDDIMINQILKQGSSFRPVGFVSVSASIHIQLGSSTTGIDEEDDTDIRHYVNKEDFMTEKKKQEMEMKQAINAHKRWENIVKSCCYCYDSDLMNKDHLM